MKQILLILLFFGSICQAQTKLPNGWWLAYRSISSASLHLEFDGYNQNAYRISVTNKQPCAVRMAIMSHQFIDTIIVNAGRTSHPGYFVPFAADTIWCKALDSCTATYDTSYWGVYTVGALPIKFKSIKAERIGKDQVKIVFDVAETTGTNVYKLRISKDARTWVNVPVKFLEGTKKGIYYVIMKL